MADVSDPSELFDLELHDLELQDDKARDSDDDRIELDDVRYSPHSMPSRANACRTIPRCKLRSNNFPLCLPFLRFVCQFSFRSSGHPDSTPPNQHIHQPHTLQTGLICCANVWRHSVSVQSPIIQRMYMRSLIVP